MVRGLSSMVGLKTESPPSVGTRGDSRGATQVNAYGQIPFTGLNKNSLCDATGKGSQRHSFQVRHIACGMWLYPCSITGAPELGYLRLCSPVQLGGPFGFCAFALLSPCGHSRPRLLGSLEIALKRTRPRQRF
jgi:hypothetical protein